VQVTRASDNQCTGATLGQAKEKEINQKKPCGFYLSCRKMKKDRNREKISLQEKRGKRSLLLLMTVEKGVSDIFGEDPAAQFWVAEGNWTAYPRTYCSLSCPSTHRT
jgi:hypothetical protein